MIEMAPVPKPYHACGVDNPIEAANDEPTAPDIGSDVDTMEEAIRIATELGFGELAEAYEGLVKDYESSQRNVIRLRDRLKFRGESDPEEGNWLEAAAKNGKVIEPLKFNTNSDIVGKRMLVETAIPLKGVGIIAGESTSGKTAMALHLAFHLVRGKNWLGRKVMHKVGVAYIAYEAPGTIEARWNALCRENNVNGEYLPFFPYPSPGSLATPEGWANLAVTIADCKQRCEKAGVRLGMIVVDTVAASGFVAKENDVDQWNASLDKMSDITEGIELFASLIHHSGKDSDNNPVRGSSAAYSNADAVLITKMDKSKTDGTTSRRWLFLDKIKEGGEPGPLADFIIDGRIVGTFESGNEFKAAFVREITAEEKAQLAADAERERKKKKEELTGYEQRFAAAIARVMREAGREPEYKDGKWVYVGNQAAVEEEVRKHDFSRNFKKIMEAALDRLAERGWVAKDDKKVVYRLTLPDKLST